MIIFQKLRYKNFLSSGNYWTDINFTEHRSTLVIGQNGAGKSTMLDALTFVLFNKPFRKINKSQLINTVNEKDCRVEITFTIGKEEYKVVRGIKPNIFEIYKNEKIFDSLASSLDQQKILEQNILKLNYKSFTQIVILGSSNFVPFMQLSLQNRREVVEDILDIKIFSSMNETAKLYLREIKDKIKQLTYEKENIEYKIETQNKLIEKLDKAESNFLEDKKSKIKDLETEKNNLMEVIDNLISKVEDLNSSISKYSDSTSKLKKFESLRGKIQQKISSIVKDHKFFTDNTVCPTCKQNIDEEFRLNKIEETQISAKELQKGFKDLELAIKDEEEREENFKYLSKEIISLNNDISRKNTTISEYEKQIVSLQSEIQAVVENNEERDIELERMNSFKTEYKKCFDEITSNKDEMSSYEFIISLLKDDGAKTKIIDKYLPLINHNLNKYLDILEFSINFSLDDEFNEKALNPIYEDFSYSSFSEGEKMRIDLSILFTWREIAKAKNSTNTNLLILDEIFDSSLDEFGTDNFSKIIRYIIPNSNVFVISHKREELEEKFENTLKFEKQKGFSILSSN